MNVASYKTQNSNKNLVLNAVPINFSDKSIIEIWQQPFSDRDHLRNLRDELIHTHLVKRHGNFIEAIPYDLNNNLLSTSSCLQKKTILLSERIDIAKALLKSWIIIVLKEKHLHHRIGRYITYISSKHDANLLNGLVDNEHTENYLALSIAAIFDIRTLNESGDQEKPVIVIDIQKRVSIDYTISNLLNIGFNPLGCYVRKKNSRRVIGRIESIQNNVLHLNDCNTKEEVLDANQAYIEPSMVNLVRILNKITGAGENNLFKKIISESAKRLHPKEKLSLSSKLIYLLEKKLDKMPQALSANISSNFISNASEAFPSCKSLSKPYLIFDTSGNKTDNWNQRGLNRYGPVNWERFPSRKLNIAVICQAKHQGEVEKFIKKFLDGIQTTIADIGFIQRFRLDIPYIQIFTTPSEKSSSYKMACAEAIDHATSIGRHWDLTLIQINESFHELQSNENPYLVCKAFFLAKNIAVQQFELETILQNDRNLAYSINNIGVACYAKVGGIPWVLPVHQVISHELVIGIGSYVASKESRFGKYRKYIGVTTVFSSDGRYILESRTRAKLFEEYLPELLSTLERAITDVKMKDGWNEYDRVRLIFHVFKPLSYIEINAVRELVEKLKLPYVDFSFISVTEDHPYLLFDESQEGVKSYGHKKGVFVPERGLMVKLSNNEVLLQLTGSNELKQWTDNHPSPLLIKLHDNSTFRDIDYLAGQIFDFSCLSWRTLLPSPTPITILYSDLIAKNLLMLKDISGWSIEDMLGPIGRTRWFL